jgi:hypothetical protein
MVVGAIVGTAVGGTAVGVGAIDVLVPDDPGLGAKAPVTGPHNKMATMIRMIAGRISWRPVVGTSVDASSAGSS